MKIATVIELAETQPTLDEVIGLARDGVVVLRKPDGSAFAVRNWTISRSRSSCSATIPTS